MWTLYSENFNFFKGITVLSNKAPYKNFPLLSSSSKWDFWLLKYFKRKVVQVLYNYQHFEKIIRLKNTW